MESPAPLAVEPFKLGEAIRLARHQHKAGAGTVLDILLREAGAQASQLSARLRAEAGVEVLQPGSAEPDFSAMDATTAATLHCVVLKSTEGGRLWLGAADPWDESLLQKVTRRIGRPLAPAAMTSEALARYLGGSSKTSPAATTPQALAVNGPVQVDGPVVSFVDVAIRSAFASGASDIHFECDRLGVTVKHRLDGVMKRYARMDGVQSAEEVISRIKVLAQLDITERRLPQDGRFRFSLGDKSIDLRVSIMPSVFGEDAVLRLLDKAQLRERDASVTLDALGFEAGGAQLIRELSAEPSGMLLVTGPTGSGKTTTVYAALSEINTGLEKIITIEDPVEYELPGVLQIPVNERKGLTFAKGLRSILRHDPDRILIGEIRDAETAEIAVQSALTGHLVFTTVHANGVTDIMGRFRHFGLDMFGFMSSLNGVVVQRLMRRICPSCVGQRPATTREQAWMEQLGRADVSGVPLAVGCSACHGTGYRGRFVVAEVHLIDDVFRDHVTEGAPVSVLKQHTYARGVETLAGQALRRVLAGETCLEEVKRVVGWL